MTVRCSLSVVICMPLFEVEWLLLDDATNTDNQLTTDN
jgi:hypothetical protein